MKSKYDFYEIVRLATECPEGLAEVAGSEGIILGMAQGETDRKWTYAVAILPARDVWCVDEGLLTSTSRFAERDGFYAGESVRVRVDPITGEGEEIDPESLG